MSTSKAVITDTREILKNARTIAVVGLSRRATRTSHKIARYLKHAGYIIVPVNPNADRLMGETSYPDLNAIPEDVAIDVVDIFRQPQFTADVVRDAVSRRDRTGNEPVIWTQVGVSSDEAEQLALSEGFTYVKDRCAKVEHGRMKGGDLS